MRGSHKTATDFFSQKKKKRLEREIIFSICMYLVTVYLGSVRMNVSEVSHFSLTSNLISNVSSKNLLICHCSLQNVLSLLPNTINYCANNF